MVLNIEPANSRLYSVQCAPLKKSKPIGRVYISGLFSLKASIEIERVYTRLAIKGGMGAIVVKHGPTIGEPVRPCWAPPLLPALVFPPLPQLANTSIQTMSRIA